MEIKTIGEHFEKSYVEKKRMAVLEIIELDWYFTGWKQKLLVLGCFLWTAYSILSFAWRLLI